MATNTLNITWVQQTSIRSTDLKTVTFFNQGTIIYAGGIDGTLLKADATGGNSPDSWSVTPTGITGTFKTIEMKTQNPSEGVALIETSPGKGQIYKTTDNGNTWTLFSDAADTYNSLHFYQNDNAVFAGYAGGENGVLKKIIGKNNYGLINIPGLPTTTLNIAAVYFLSDNEGWVAGNSGTIYHTTNANTGAVTWTPVNTGITGVNADFKKIYFK